MGTESYRFTLGAFEYLIAVGDGAFTYPAPMVDQALPLAFHFPIAGVGHDSQEGHGWQWQPL